MCCAVCERACTVDTLSTEAETLNNAARWAGLPLLHLLRQVGRNADDAMCWPKYTTCSQQTAPAGAISVALPFSLRLFCKPLPYLSFHFFLFCFLKKAQLYFFFLIVLLLPFSIAAVHHVHHDRTHKPSVSSCCLHFWTYPSCSLIWTNKKKAFSVRRYANEVARNQKAKMLSLGARKCQTHKGW